MRRFRDLMIDGLLIALPIGVVLYLLYRVVKSLGRALHPIAAMVPQQHVFGLVALADVLAVLVLMVALAALGLFAHSPFGRKLQQSLERQVMRKIPGYLLFKSMAAGVTGHPDAKDDEWLPVLVAFDDNTVLGFLVERPLTGHGLATVYVPSAPTPAAGATLLVEWSRVTIIDASFGNAMSSVIRMGMGTQELIGAGPADKDAAK